jgi:hypothetical protein
MKVNFNSQEKLMIKIFIGIARSFQLFVVCERLKKNCSKSGSSSAIKGKAIPSILLQ